jgi:hypothetical protein
MGAERRSQYIDDQAKLMTAYHEVRYVTLFVPAKKTHLRIREGMLLWLCTQKARCPCTK